MRVDTIKTFYSPKQVCHSNIDINYSKSPSKPEKMMSFLTLNKLDNHFDITSDFGVFDTKDILLAHTDDYVNNFLVGKGNCESNNLKWSNEFKDSVLYNLSSFYAAIRNSIVNSDEVSFSPSSGFHHATPYEGRDSCTFSGQVISSVKIFMEFGLSGCYLDLDAHFGNSIQDSRDYVECLDKAIPRGFNFNPCLKDDDYIAQLENFLLRVLEPAILNKQIHYVVWCHGADSHSEDQLGHQCNTESWLKCAELFWGWIKKMDGLLGECLPVSCSLFGGYRDDDFNSVLSLHTGDLVTCLNILLMKNVSFSVEVKKRTRTENIIIPVVSLCTEWMSDDLDTDIFNNGDIILNAKDSKLWQFAADNKIAAYREIEMFSENKILQKKIYNWYAINDSRGIAPIGFRIPSEDDFRLLSINKSIIENFISQANCFVDYYGFEFVSDFYAFYWSDYENDIYNSVYVKLNTITIEAELGNAYKCFGFAVRCIKT